MNHVHALVKGLYLAVALSALPISHWLARSARLLVADVWPAWVCSMLGFALPPLGPPWIVLKSCARFNLEKKLSCPYMQCLNGLKSSAAKTKSWFDHDWKYLYKVRSECTHFNFQFSSEGPDSSLCFFTWWWQTLPKATVKDLTHSNIQKKILWTSSVSLMLATWWVVVAISTAAMSHPLENRECLASSTTAGHGLRIEGQYNSIAV